MVRLKAGQKPRHRPRSQGQSPNSPPRRPAPAAFTASTQVSRPPPGPTTSASKTKRSPFNVRPLSHCRAGPRGHASRRTPDATAQPRHGRKGQPYNRSPPSFVIRHSAPAPRARLVLGPISRIMFRALRHFDCHFSQQLASLSRRSGMRHTRDYWTGRPVAYFALHPSGFFVPPFSRTTRWALTPPFHPYRSGISDLKFEISNPDRRFVFCDTVRRVALKRRSRTWG